MVRTVNWNFVFTGTIVRLLVWELLARTRCAMLLDVGLGRRITHLVLLSSTRGRRGGRRTMSATSAVSRQKYLTPVLVLDRIVLDLAANWREWRTRKSYKFVII